MARKLNYPVRIHTSLKEETFEDLKVMAASDNMTVSEMVRQILEIVVDEFLEDMKEQLS